MRGAHLQLSGWLTLLLLCAGGVSSLPAQAQTNSRVQWSLRPVTVAALHAGAEVPVTLVAAIEPGWHIYSLTQKSGGPIALRISVPSGEPFVLAGAVRGPRPEITHDSTLDIPIELHSGVAEFTVPLRLTAGASGVLEGRIVTRYQACSETLCLPPRSIALPVRLSSAASDGIR